MVGSQSWDWDTSEKIIAVSDWEKEYQWVEEPYASPDGEKVAAIVNIDEAEFNVCVNGELWGEEVYDKLWYLRFSPDNRLTVLAGTLEGWTMLVDGTPWAEEECGYIWGTQFSEDGKTIIASVQQDEEYGVAVNGTLWENLYANISNVALSADGSKTAATVQTVDFNEGEIFKFQDGCFTAAVNGQTWDQNFINVWDMTFSPDNQTLAAEVRLNLYDYTIAVNGKPWDQTFQCVWKPIFHPTTGAIIAPVRLKGKWTLAQDGQPVWKNDYNQCWHPQFSPDGKKLAAIVSPQYGLWTVAVDDKAWEVTTGDMVTDMVFSPNSERVAALTKDGETWGIITDGMAWGNTFDMAWKPVFSPNGLYLAAKVEKNGKYTLAINDRLWDRECDALWDPIFSEDGQKVLVRSIENGNYYRRVIPVGNL